MLFTPSTNLKILRNVPLDNTYKNTITFVDPVSQANFFGRKMKVQFDDFTFQRLNSSIRVPTDPNNLYDCNYIMFQNENFGDKWFYAFIKEINYLNQNVSEIVFEMDVYQTWILSCQIKQCMVEREHVNDDTPFTWFAPEPFTPSDYMAKPDTIWQGYTSNWNLTPYITVACTKDADIGQIPKMYSGIYSGLWFFSAPVTNYNLINDLINRLDGLGKSSAIVSIFMSPYPVTPDPFTKDFDTGVNVKSNNFNTYIIKNNKLLNYPFTKIKVKSTDGNEMELKPELVNGDTLKVKVWFTTALTPTLTLTPDYANIASNFEYAIQYTENPQCAWSSNLYANWLAQNEVSLRLNKLNAISNLTTGLVSGGMSIGGATNLLTNTVQPWVEQDKMSRMPGNAGGIPASSSLNYAFDRLGFEVWLYRPIPPETKMFDDYLTRYGYAINQVKVPNVSGRKSWNYVKTSGAVVTGNAPADDLARIRQMLNDGITFWHGDFVGDYSQPNPII